MSGTITLTLNLLPTLMKPSLPAFCLESLLVIEFSNSSRTNPSLDSDTKLSSDMCRASLFFSTNRVCGQTRRCIPLYRCTKCKNHMEDLPIPAANSTHLYITVSDLLCLYQGSKCVTVREISQILRGALVQFNCQLFHYLM